MKSGRAPKPKYMQKRVIQDPKAPNPFMKILNQESVIAITPNICEEKHQCSKCKRGDRYGIPLHFILHCPTKGIETVCYKCGIEAADKAGLQLPPTEQDIFASISAPDSEAIRKGYKKRRKIHE